MQIVRKLRENREAGSDEGYDSVNREVHGAALEVSTARAEYDQADARARIDELENRVAASDQMLDSMPINVMMADPVDFKITYRPVHRHLPQGAEPPAQSTRRSQEPAAQRPDQAWRRDVGPSGFRDP